MLNKIQESNQVMPTNMIQKFLNMNDVISITGKSRSTINRWVKKGSFPDSIQLGENSKAWPIEVISEWRESKINQSTTIARGL